MFQRRHYEAVADLLHKFLGPKTTGIAVAITDAFADLFEGDSDRFDRGKFMRQVINGKKGE